MTETADTNTPTESESIGETDREAGGAADADADAEADAGPLGGLGDGHRDGEGRDVTDYLYWVAFAVLTLLALFATIRFYLSASEAISIWVAREYRPIFQSAFNLVVVLACGIGLSLLVRRMRR